MQLYALVGESQHSSQTAPQLNTKTHSQPVANTQIQASRKPFIQTSLEAVRERRRELSSRRARRKFAVIEFVRDQRGREDLLQCGAEAFEAGTYEVADTRVAFCSDVGQEVVVLTCLWNINITF